MDFSRQITNDKPLGFHWSVPDKLLDCLDLPAVRNTKERVARNSIIAEALIAHRSGQFVSFSLNRNHYSAQGRYHGTAYSYTRVRKSVFELRDLGLLEVNKAAVGALGRQSVFRATPALIEAVRDPAFASTIRMS